ncbi:MAG: hypothetical protein PHH77_03535 [Victivallaceae bacterium]|nr:hypothetical protein [Victivallaceae bacterium]
MKKTIKYGNAIANDYRLIGVGCIVLSDFCISVGTSNIVGGYAFKAIDYNAETRELTLADGTDMDKFQVDYHAYLAGGSDDDNSPHEVTIIGVDPETRKLTLASDLVMTGAGISPDSPAIGAIRDASREATAFSSGDFNLITGEYSTGGGTLNVESGLGNRVHGVMNRLTGNMSDIDGSNNIGDGDNLSIKGNNNKLIGMTGNIAGFSNTGIGDNLSLNGALNDFQNCSHVTVNGFSNHGSNCNIIHVSGALNTITADYTQTHGYRLKNHAKWGIMFGRDAELENSPENEGAFVVGGGEINNPRRAFEVRSRRKIVNPLYNPANDPDGDGIDDAGEKQYLNQLGFFTRYPGHLLSSCNIQTVNNDSGTVLNVPLDHDFYGRWKITPTGSGQITFNCDNWEDGDFGILTVYAGAGKVSWPAAWKFITVTMPLIGELGGPPDMSASGYVFIIMFKHDNDIFCLPAITSAGGVDI